MKRLVLAALIATAFAPAAFANTYGQTLPATDLAEIQKIVPNADLSSLSDTQVAALASALNSGSSHSDVVKDVRSALN